MNRYCRDLFIKNCCSLQNEASPDLITILWCNQSSLSSSLLRLMIATMALLAFFWLQAIPAHAQDSIVAVSYEAVTLPDPLEVGQEITYKIKWACSSSTDTCGAFSMDYALPDGLDFVSVAAPANYVGTEDNNVINISTEPGAELNDGDSVEATVVLRVGYDYDGTDPTTTLPVQGEVTVATDSGAGVNESDPLDPVTLNKPVDQWDVSKTRNLPNTGISPAVGNPVGYEVRFCSDSVTGNVDLTNAVLVDTFPAGATVIDDGGGVVDMTNNTITWDIGDLNYYTPNNCFVQNIILNFPDGAFDSGDNVRNDLDGTATGSDGSTIQEDDRTQDTLADPALDVALAKSSENQIVGPDSLAEFRFSIDSSASNADVDNFVLVETIPPELELTTIHAGQWRDSPQVSARIEYQERGGITWTTLGTVDANADTVYQGGVLGSDFGSNVGAVRWVFTMPTGDGIPSGFRTSGNTPPRIWARPIEPIAPGINLVWNCAGGEYIDPVLGRVQLPDECGSVRLTDEPTTVSDIIKTSATASNIGPGEPISFRLSLDLLEESSADWINPIVTDTLPAGLAFVSWDNVASDFNGGTPADRLPAFTTSTLPTGETLLVWSWTGANAWTIPASPLDRVHKRHVIQYTATPAAGTVPGFYENVARYTSDSPNEDCNNDPTCEDANTITVRGVGLLESDKWVSGDPNLNYVNSVTNPEDLYILDSPVDPTCPTDGTGMTHYPCVARSYPGETLPYRLEVTNGGNIPLRDYILYDVMPHGGDVGVSEALSTDPRGSDWSTLLTGPVVPSSLPAGITAGDLRIEYSDLIDSCRREVSATSDENGWQSGCVDDWIATPDNWEDVKSFRIAFVDDSVKWPTLTSMVFSMTVRIPETGVPGGSAAWNSIAHRATNDTDGSRLLTADPRKAGVIIPYYDWGDLPDLDADGSASPAYNTDFTTVLGPGHMVIPQLYLGAGVDAEDDGQPADTALGDDNSTGDYSVGTVDASGNDEDGVKFLTPIMPGQPVVIEVTSFIDGPPGVTSTLGIWIDFNGDGTFVDDEFFVQTLTNTTGGPAILIGNIELTAPSEVADEVYSRFRLAFDPDEVGQLEDSTGSARSGEVEDYVLMSLGNRVWMDDGIGGGTPDNGILDGSEQGIPDVIVELYNPGDTPGVDPPLATTTTDPNGEYLFTGLAPDDYVIHLPDTNFAPGQPLENLISASDTPTSGNVDPDTDPDNESGPTGDENGINGPDPATNGISSQPVTLDTGTEPDTPADGNGPNSNQTVDFAMVSPDLSMIKTRSPGQTYAANFSTTPPTVSFDITLKNQGSATAYNATVLDTIPTGMSFQSLGAIQGTATVSNTGPAFGGHTFLVDELAPDESVTFQIVLQIDDLNQGSYTNIAEVADIQDSTGNSVPDADSTPDTDPTNDPVDTTEGIDPTGVNDQNSHNNIDHTGPGDEDDHDQEVVLGGMALGNRVWDDRNNNGTVDSGEPGIGNVLVEVYTVNGAGDPIGPPVATDTTDGNGYWMVDNLPPGNYIAVIPATNFAPSAALEDMVSSSDVATTADPNTDQESDDNGIGSPRGTTATGPISSGVITLAPTGEPLQGGSEGDLGPGHGNAGDIFDNLTVDFGFFQYDMTDGPDSYGTTLGNDGPRHILDGTTFLGSSVDSDPDGTPSLNADGDDTPTGSDPTDDEDGVTFLSSIVAGEPFTIAVQASTNGFLNTWIDFDGNGTFDPGEQLTTDQPLNAGTNILVITAPAVVDEDSLYSRFRFTADSGDATTPTGEAATGEVEDYILMSLGNTVWADNGPDGNGGNGIQDPSEPGIPEAIVELYPEGATPGVDEPLATTTTDENGDYIFTGLMPGNYVVYLPEENFMPDAPLEEHFSSRDPNDTPVDPDNDEPMDDNGMGDGTDDPTTEGIQSMPITLVAGTEPTNDGDGRQSNRTVSFGLVEYDKGDLPDSAVGVGPGNYETLTDHDGPMHGIIPNVYLGAGVDADLDGQPNVDATGDDSDSDGNDDDGVTFTSRILPGQMATVDVVANVDGYLNAWMDFNGDGDFDDPGEQLATDTNLITGTNSLSFPVPNTALASTLYSRFRFTSDDPAGALLPTGMWDNGEVEDYGINTQSLGNQVWHDLDNDGVQDAGEPGLDGVLVNLLDPTTGEIILTDTTADGGHYLFNSLTSGDYRVEIAASNFLPGGPLAEMKSSEVTESDPNADGDGNDNGIDAPLGSPIQSGIVTLTEDGEPTTETALGPDGHGNAPDDSSNLTVDFGFFIPVIIGDEVWLDEDRDGIQDEEEPGVPDVTVILYDTETDQPVVDDNDVPVTDVTDDDGNYLFDDLPPDDYYVVFDPDTLPDDHAPTLPNVTNPEQPGISDQTDSDVTVDPVTLLPQTPPTGMLNSGEEDLTQDFGIQEVNNIRVGDRIWFDNNKDGIQGAVEDEPGVPDMGVTLYDASTGQPVMDEDGNPRTDVTDENGNYLFDELPAGNYYVIFDLSTLPQNYVVTAPSATGDDSLDSDADPTTGATSPTGSLRGGEEDLTLDMGIRRLDTVRVGDRVWYDTDKNGVQDSPEDEPGVPNIVVMLYDNVTNLPVTAGDGNALTDVTNTSGHYLFDNLPPGDYYVVFDLTTLPPNYVVTDQNMGGDDGIDSDANSTTGATSATGMLNSNEQNLTLDMGIQLVENIVIGDKVWLDSDKDGIQDGTEEEPGVPGVVVTLYDTTTDAPVTDDNGDPVTDVTDGNGEYAFTDLPPGDYYVVFDPDTLPLNHVITTPNQGEDDTVDSDADPDSGATSPTGVLNSNEADLTLDLGIQLLENIRIGDKVWFDNNKDGIQGTADEEPGVADIGVMLYDADSGEPILGEDGNPLTDVTDENGNYLFENLQPGNYYVVFDLDTLPQNFVVTEPSAGEDEANDSDGDPSTGATEPTGMLNSGDEDLTLDLGLVLLESVQVGDRVWLDTDLNGVQGPARDEPGVPNVAVTLYDNGTNAPVTDGDGNPLTDVTDENGKYLFDDLAPGDYYVVFDLSSLPPNHVATEQNLGDDDRRDSDGDPATGATAPTGMLNSSERDLTLDLGILKVNDISVGDQVWFDHNGDGVQGTPEEEPGVPGMGVTLYDANTGEPVTDEDGNPLTDVTDENGNYLFEDLFPGNYYVVFDLDTLPQNYVATRPSASSDDTLDSDGDPTTGATGPTGLLQTGDDNLTLDLGVVRLDNIEIGDKVWYDSDKNGVQGDPVEEPGVPNVLVMLYHSATGEPVISEDGNPVTDATNATGDYLFDDLPPGDYYVVFDLTTIPPNYIVTTQDTGGDDEADSDADPVTGATGPTGQLNSNDKDLSLDLGIQRVDNIIVGDQVWLDSDKDGIQDGTEEEPGVPDVVVTILDTTTGQPITDEEGTPLTDTTDENGEYLFTDLPPGDYTVVFDLDTLPPNHVVTDQDETPTGDDENLEGTPDELDSDVDPSTGVSQPTGPINSNESDLSLDLGVQELDNVRIGDRVWFDINEDGVQGTPADEPGVPDITVMLYDSATRTPVTDGSGDPLIVVTDENGNYLFDNLPPGDYYVLFDLGSLPENHVATDPGAGDDPTRDSDGDPITGETGSTGQLNSGDEYLALDLGIVELPRVTVGDFVWLDDNGNGIQNQDEEGVPGITVYVYDVDTNERVTDDDGTPLTQVTDENGEYLFTGLLPGQYYVEFDLTTLPDGLVVTPPDGSPSDRLDSDANPETGITPPTSLLLSGDQDHTLDMGVYEPIDIGDRVWFDDGNGQQDDGEAGVPNIGVTLYRINNDGTSESIGTTTTDENGNYLFEDLPPGNYIVEFDLATLPDGFIVTPPNVGDDGTDSDADPATGQTTPTGFLSSGTDVLTLDMGITRPVEIGDTVWLDNDRDGLQDEGEPGVENVSVTLYDVTGTPVETTTTDSDGNYAFDDLIPGVYYVDFDLDTLPGNHVVTRPNVVDAAQPATSDEFDSDANPETGRTPNTEYLLGGVVEDSLDMGIQIPDDDLVRIGDLVWEDANGDGEFSPGESGLPGITLELYSADDPTTPIMTTVTDDDGFYLFDNLLPGEYLVKVVPDTLPEDAYPPIYYGNDPPNNEASSSGPLGPGEEALNLDIAITRPGSLTGIAWAEIEIDGIKTPTETVLSEVTVQLYDGDGTLVTETVTGPDGSYLFEDLKPDEYLVQFMPPPITGTVVYTITHQQQGDDPAIDSDPYISTGTTDIIPVGSGEDVTDIDVGMYDITPMAVVSPPQTIGSLVWSDDDKDGIQDEGEVGVPGIIVELLNENGEVVGTTTTDNNGLFLFSVMTGTYQLSFPTLPLDEQVFTLQDQGDNDTKDSDVDPLTGLTGMIVVTDNDELLDYAAGIFVRPSSVRLTSLRSEEVYVDPSRFGVRVSWSTSTELDTFGFEIYRSHDSNFRNALPIADSIVLSQGGDAEYEFIDTTPLVDHLYGYWMVEIQNDGTKYPHGPMRVEIVGVDPPVEPLSDPPPGNSIYLPIVQQQ